MSTPITPESLRRRAAQYRRRARIAREHAEYADSAQARGMDMDIARNYDREARELEERAAELEASPSARPPG